jgi:hypothetical protein
MGSFLTIYIVDVQIICALLGASNMTNEEKVLLDLDFTRNKWWE